MHNWLEIMTILESKQAHPLLLNDLARAMKALDGKTSAPIAFLVNPSGYGNIHSRAYSGHVLRFLHVTGMVAML